MYLKTLKTIRSTKFVNDRIFDFAQSLKNPEIKLSTITVAHLENVLEDHNSHYSQFTQKKRNGKERVIDRPLPWLKNYQKVIQHSLERKYTPSTPIYGVKGKGIIDMARKHTDSDYVILIDMENFFPSITQNAVRDMFMREYHCTVEIAEILAKLCCKEGKLPQGSPASPIIANILCQNLDKEISNECLKPSWAHATPKHTFRYTRYVDDIYISIPKHENFTGSSSFNPKDLLNEIKDFVTKSITSSGFKVNAHKCKFQHKSGIQRVTNISVRGKSIAITRKYHRQLRDEMHQMLSTPPLTLLKKREKVLGKLNHLKNVEGDTSPKYLRLKAKWQEVRDWIDPAFMNIFSLSSLHTQLARYALNKDWDYLDPSMPDTITEIYLDKFFDKRLEAEQAIAFFANDLDFERDPSKTENSLLYLFDIWHDVLWGRSFKNIKKKYGRRKKPRPIESFIPSSFILGHNLWRKNILHVLEIYLTLARARPSVFTKAKQIEAVDTVTAIELLIDEEEQDLAKKLIAHDYGISMTHLHGLSLLDKRSDTDKFNAISIVDIEGRITEAKKNYMENFVYDESVRRSLYKSIKSL